MYCVALQEAYNGDTLKTHSNTQLATQLLAIRKPHRKLLRSSVKSALTASGFLGAEPLRGCSNATLGMCMSQQLMLLCSLNCFDVQPCLVLQQRHHLDMQKVFVQ